VSPINENVTVEDVPRAPILSVGSMADAEREVAASGTFTTENIRGGELTSS
jgi:hypothetical protein